MSNGQDKERGPWCETGPDQRRIAVLLLQVDRVWVFCSLRVGATPRVVYACVLRVEGRTTAPGSRCSSRRCHAEERRRTVARTRCEARTGRRMAARRALGRGHDGAGAVGDLSDGDARHAGVWWSTRNAGRGQRGRATGHCSARRGICPRMRGR